MHDAASVGEAHCLERGHEELDSPPNGKVAVPGPGEQILAVDVLERQEPDSVRRLSAVEEACNSRMLEGGQDADLVAEPAQRLFVEGRPVDHLECDGAMERLRLLHREKDAPHSAAPELAHDAIDTDALGKMRVGNLIVGAGLPGSAVERRDRVVAARQHRRELRREGGIAARDVAQQRLSAWIVELQRASEELRQFRAHENSLDRDEPFDRDTLQEIGSRAKTFTSAAAAPSPAGG